MIRSITADDIPQLLALGHAMHEESPRFRRFPFNEAKLTTVLENLIRQPEINCSFVSESGRILDGLIIGMVGPHFFTDALIASDLAVYVAPEKRGLSVAARLIKAYEAKAERLGAIESNLGISTEVAVDRTVALYSHLGYAMNGHLMVKRLRDV